LALLAEWLLALGWYGKLETPPWLSVLSVSGKKEVMIAERDAWTNRPTFARCRMRARVK
jgi:hypothetical protein